MRKSIRRIGAIVGTTAAAGAMSVAMAAPANATAWDCSDFLARMGYAHSSQIDEACAVGERIERYPDCLFMLLEVVAPRDAEIACKLALW